MAWVGDRLGVSTDYAYVGAVVGLVISVVVFIVLMGISAAMDRGERSTANLGCGCVMRMVALLVLTLGMGAGYMIGRAMAGGL